MEETMEALDELVREGKVRALGASAMYAYQLHNLQIIARDHGWTPFTSMQCHYNLLYREDEREMIPVCRQLDMALTPYSPMASGHLCRPTWESSSTRGTTDKTMVNKYDHDRVIDMPIVERVAKVAADHGVPMSQIALAWHWARGVAAPIVGCSKPERVDDAVAALDITLSARARWPQGPSRRKTTCRHYQSQNRKVTTWTTASSTAYTTPAAAKSSSSYTARPPATARAFVY